MGGPTDERAVRAFLNDVQVGDVISGTVIEVADHGAQVRLDGFPAGTTGVIGSLDFSWRRRRDEAVEVGQRIAAEVVAVDAEEGRIRLSLAATENPELWAFLKTLRPGDVLSDIVAAVESFGVFVALDDGPPHPLFSGVGLITLPELSWCPFETVAQVVDVGQRVTCSVLSFDTSNGEARLSLRALQPDPFQEFAQRFHEGQVISGEVTKLAPFGAFVRVADGIEGLVHLSELSDTRIDKPEQAVQIGDQIEVTIAGIDRTRRRLSLSYG